MKEYFFNYYPKFKCVARSLVNAIENDDNVRLGNIDRFEFYERAKTAYAVVATGEEAVYDNIILKKGVIK